MKPFAFDDEQLRPTARDGDVEPLEVHLHFEGAQGGVGPVREDLLQAPLQRRAGTAEKTHDADVAELE